MTFTVYFNISISFIENFHHYLFTQIDGSSAKFVPLWHQPLELPPPGLKR